MLNCAVMRKRSPERWTLPSSTAATFSCRPTARMSGFLPLNWKAEPRATTRNPCDFGEGVNQIVCQAVAEVLVFLIGAQVHERKYGDGRRIRSGGPRMRPAAHTSRRSTARASASAGAITAPIRPPARPARRQPFSLRAGQHLETGRYPPLRQIDPDGVGGAFGFVIFLQAGSQFHCFNAYDAIQARIVTTGPAENFDAQQRFL